MRNALGQFSDTDETQTVEERFRSYCTTGLTPAGCIEFMGSLKNDRYPGFSYKGRVHKASRVAWELARGPIPEGQHVLHSCDNPRCVRPDHLFLGTVADNMRDMAAKGRGNRALTACKHGHPFDAENTYEYERKDGRKRRACKACQSLHAMGVTLKDGRYYAKNGNPFPIWWSPEQRFAWRVHKFGGTTELMPFDTFAFGGIPIKVTADLETGEEVTA